MKNFLLFLVVSLLSPGLFAQSLSLSDEHGAIAPGGTVLVVGDPMDPTIVAEIDVTNNGSAALDVKVFRRIVDVLPNTSNYFCWGACFDPITDTSLTQLNIPAGGTNTEFSGDFEPMEQIGSSYITYVFYDANNMADSVSVTVQFKASPEGIAETLLGQISFSNPYPNPANKTAYFDYFIPEEASQARLVISNMLGAVVETVRLPVNDNRIAVNAAGFKNGLYICTLEVQGSVVITRKMVVNH